MVRVADLAREVRELAVDVGGGVTITVSYRPNWHTLALEEELMAEALDAANGTLRICSELTNWDLEDNDGNQIPLTREGIKEHNVPARVLWIIIRAISDDMSPKETRQNGSSPS